VLAVVLLLAGCASQATPEQPFPDKAAPCQGLKTAASGTTVTLTRLTAVYEACDGTGTKGYVKGNVSVIAHAGNGRELIVGPDYTMRQVLNGWIIPEK
jgi:hypothetical protein